VRQLALKEKTANKYNDATYDIGDPQKAEHGIMDTLYFSRIVLAYIQRYLKIYDIRYSKVHVRSIA
jgi:hypothetical protein